MERRNLESYKQLSQRRKEIRDNNQQVAKREGVGNHSRAREEQINERAQSRSRNRQISTRIHSRNRERSKSERRAQGEKTKIDMGSLRQETQKSTVPEMVALNLIEEKNRQVDVYIKDEKDKRDIQIAEAFWKYGPVEYVFQLEESMILCFLT